MDPEQIQQQTETPNDAAAAAILAAQAANNANTETQTEELPDPETLFAPPALTPEAQQYAYQLALTQQAMAFRDQQDEQRQAAEVSQFINGLPAERQQQARAAYAVWQQMNGLQRELAATKAREAQIIQRVAPQIADMQLREMSQKSGVPFETLKKWGGNSPDTAMALARFAIDMKRQQSQTTRREANLDSTPSAGANMTTSATPDVVKQKFVGTGKIADFIREQRRNGAWN